MKSLPGKKELTEAIINVMKISAKPIKTSEINEKVAALLKIPDELLELEDANCTGTEFSYRMRWARTELKQKGLIVSGRRGEWELV